MPIPVIAAVAGGAVLEAATGVVSKTFKKTRKPRKAKKAGTRKTKTRSSATRRKKSTKRKSTARKKTRKTTSKSSAINKSTGRLKKGFKYSKGGRIVKAKKK